MVVIFTCEYLVAAILSRSGRKLSFIVNVTTLLCIAGAHVITWLQLSCTLSYCEFALFSCRCEGKTFSKLAKMLTCHFCSKTLETLRGYVLHCKVHRNEPHPFFKCVGTDCKRTFCTYAAFKGHFYRVHNAPEPSITAGAVVTDFKCSISLCECKFNTVKELISHLKNHITEGRTVPCPITGCENAFTVKSSFTAHMSRKHRKCSVDSISDKYREHPSAVSACEDAPQSSNDATANESELPQDFNETFLRNVCLFYLKLQGQLLLPASTIQTIVEEMQNIHELGQEYTLSEFFSLPLHHPVSLFSLFLTCFPACPLVYLPQLTKAENKTDLTRLLLSQGDL